MPDFAPRKTFTGPPPWNDVPLNELVKNIKSYKWTNLSPDKKVVWEDNPTGGPTAFCNLMDGKAAVRFALTSGAFKYREVSGIGKTSGQPWSETQVYYGLPKTHTSRLAPLFKKLLASVLGTVAAATGTVASPSGDPLSWNVEPKNGEPLDDSLVNWVKFRIPEMVCFNSDQKEGKITYAELMEHLQAANDLERTIDTPKPTEAMEVAYFAPGLVLSKSDKGQTNVYLYVRLVRADICAPDHPAEPDVHPEPILVPETPQPVEEDENDHDEQGEIPNNQQALPPAATVHRSKKVPSHTMFVVGQKNEAARKRG